MEAMMMTEIICDNKRLMYSNRICCISNDSVSLKIDLATNAEINIIFNFHDENGEEIKTTMQSPENRKVVFDLTNYANPLGTGITKPVKIGVLNDKIIYIIFYVYRLSKDAFPILDVSLYLEV